MLGGGGSPLQQLHGRGGVWVVKGSRVEPVLLALTLTLTLTRTVSGASEWLQGGTVEPVSLAERPVPLTGPHPNPSPNPSNLAARRRLGAALGHRGALAAHALWVGGV